MNRQQIANRESLLGTSSEVAFTVEGDVVRGTKYLPSEPSESLPVVVMAHGWSMVAGGDLEDYATVVSNRGFAVLTFDFRNLGKSDGTPRQEIDPYAQIEDIRSAISFVRTWPEIDSGRIGIWGSSYSGGHSLVVAAIDPRVKCVVAQVPTTSGYEAGLRRAPHDKAQELQQRILADREARFAGSEPEMIQTISNDPAVPAAYPQKDSYDYMSFEGGRCPSWRNEVTLRSLEKARQYEPVTYIKRIGPVPLLMIIADDDGLTPSDLQREAFNLAHEPKELLQVSGGHYSVYLEHFSETSVSAANWFMKHLQ